MPRWMQPTEESPQVEAGDRIVIIVKERLRSGGPLVRRLVILEATKTGWDSPDPTYEGYTVEDGLLWSTEKDVCQIESVINQESQLRDIASTAKVKVNDIGAWIASIDKRIKNVASAGKFNLDRPFGVRMPCSPEQKKKIKEYYVAKGFTWDINDSISWGRQ